MSMNKAAVGLSLMGVMAMPASLITANYFGTPIEMATGVIKKLSYSFTFGRGPVCYIEIDGNGVGIATLRDKQMCSDKLHEGQQVSFHYRQGRLMHDNLIVDGEDAIKPL